MGRDNEHYFYKNQYACFDCRKCFKQRSSRELICLGQMSPDQPRIVPCPQCQKPMKYMGWDFKVPKQKDVEQWKKVELLVQNGYIFFVLLLG